MGSTSIKVQEDTKLALDDLQAEVTTALGRKVTLQELAAVLAELGLRERDRVLAAFADRPRKLTAAQLRRLMALRIETPIATDAADLDGLIYGDPHGEGRRNAAPARKARRPPRRRKR
jgi:hypothetical protein